MTRLNFQEIKNKQQLAWGSGDYGKIGVTLQITGENLCEFMDIRSGQQVLDVAAGNGNATLAAARRFCNVTSTDYVPALLDQGKRRCEANGLAAKFQQADAENLPFKNDQFDVVLSTFGVMFTPNQQQSAAELLRVCRPGGKIGLANWTPDGFIGQLFTLIGKYITPPKGLASPVLWGTEKFLNNEFASARKIEFRKRAFCFRYESAAHWIDLFREYYGPIHKAFQALQGEQFHSFESDLYELIRQFNQSTGDEMLAPSDYLEVAITV